jgi:hypothetical protein
MPALGNPVGRSPRHPPTKKTSLQFTHDIRRDIFLSPELNDFKDRVEHTGREGMIRVAFRTHAVSKQMAVPRHSSFLPRDPPVGSVVLTKIQCP